VEIAMATKISAKTGPVGGRPSIYTAEIAEAICERLAAGESLKSICRDDAMPAESTVRNWAQQDVKGFYEMYTRARNVGLDAIADEILDIADDDSRDSQVDEKGAERPNPSAIQRDRLRVDARRWYLSKLAPKRYGERVQVEGGGDTSITVVSPITAPPGSQRGQADFKDLI
jgi:hypothetical protein